MIMFTAYGTRLFIAPAGSNGPWEEVPLRAPFWRGAALERRPLRSRAKRRAHRKKLKQALKH